jgi:hypothetical protein
MREKGFIHLKLVTYVIKSKAWQMKKPWSPILNKSDVEGWNLEKILITQKKYN